MEEGRDIEAYDGAFVAVMNEYHMQRSVTILQQHKIGIQADGQTRHSRIIRNAVIVTTEKNGKWIVL